MNTHDVPPPIHSRREKSKNEVQAQLKDTVTLPKCFCDLCKEGDVKNLEIPNLY